MKRGTIQSYDPRTTKGVVMPDDGGPYLAFRYPRNTDLIMFEPGDRVEFEVSDNKAINVEIYYPVDIDNDIYRCPRCRRYLRFVEVERRILDGDWGNYFEIHCRKCGAQCNGSGRLSTAFGQYKNGIMPEQVALEFEQALADRNLMPDFLSRNFKFH